MERALQAAANFISPDEVIAGVEPCGQGIIHDTFLVMLNSGTGRFILQRINMQVFADPEALMHNLRLVCDHIQKKTGLAGSRIGAEWQMLEIMPARDGRDFFIDADGVFWRAVCFIEGAVPLEQISSPDDAREVGRALGTFHRLVSDLNPELLYDTLPGFHNVEHYLARYDAAADRDRDISGLEKYCRQFVADRREWAPVLENARRADLVKLRVIHGDPKSNNIMVSKATGKAVSIIDLDTVMAGLVHYDIGDCLRSCCNTRGEDAADLSEVRFDLARCKEFLAGYAGTAKDFLTGSDVFFLFAAIRLIPFELGLRFCTDFLEGNIYFKVSRRDQNLDRAAVQFKLVESIERQKDEIRKIIEKCYAEFTGRDSR